MQRAVEAELKRLGRNLRAARDRMGISQEHAAELVGIHDTTLQRIEVGKANVSIAMLVAICRAYEITLGSLFGQGA